MNTLSGIQQNLNGVETPCYAAVSTGVGEKNEQVIISARSSEALLKVLKSIYPRTQFDAAKFKRSLIFEQ